MRSRSLRQTHGRGRRGWASVGLLVLVCCACQDRLADRPAAETPAADHGSPGSTATRADTNLATAIAHIPARGAEKSALDVKQPTGPAKATQRGPSPDRTARSGEDYPLQDNPLAGCTMCHADVEDEFSGSKHFQKKVGCKSCHGPSEGHVADENNEVKPDQRFARKDVDRLCRRCHACGRSEQSGPATTVTGQPPVCTDCHGHHTLAPISAAMETKTKP